MSEAFLSTFGGGIEIPEEVSLQPGSAASFLDTFGGPKMEEFSFYNDTVHLMFDKESWTWFLVGELGELTEQYGVTGTIKIMDKSEMLVPWAAKMCVEKLLRTIPTQTISTGTDDLNPLHIVPMITLADFTKIAMEAKSAHRDKLEDAGFVGHMAHAFIEKWINATLAGTELPEVKLDDERAVKCVNAFMKWHAAHGVRWVSTEQKIYSKEHQFAGTLDGTAYYSSCTDKSCCFEQFTEQLMLADFKTSNAIRLDYVLQTSAYRKAFLEEHGTAIGHAVVIRLGKEDGEFETLQLNAKDLLEGFEAFLACLNLLIAVEATEATWKDKKQAKRAAEKELRAIAKAAQKEQEKLEKAEAKAQAKVEREAEKLRLKEEAKAERARLKAEIKKQTEEEQHKPVSIPTEES